jgi:coenzyme Q-binding protein COQ10
MPNHKETKILPYAAKQMFDLVMDIEKYPQFLPWCANAKITDKISDRNLHADLIISFKGIKQKYSSDVRYWQDENGPFFVSVVAIDGIFKSLVNSWSFEDVKNDAGAGCKVEFFIDFEFKSKILGKMIGLVFASATKKMIASFQKRAENCFSK